MKNILFTILFFVLIINVKAQENAPTSDFAEVEQYVLDKLKVWQERGKYEPTAEYEQRVSLSNRNKEIEKYTSEALKMFAPRKVRTIGNVSLGEYNPDFGLVMKRKSLKSGNESEFYFVIETKGTNDINDKKALTEGEVYKIKCAMKHFATLGVEVHYNAPIKDYQFFRTEVDKTINKLIEAV